MSLPRRYNIVKSLGGGAHGEVFLALDRERANTPVALKRLRNLAFPASALAAEFATLFDLFHPNIARVHDYGETSTGPYYTSDYVGGGNLFQAFQRVDASAREQWILQIAADALAALAYLDHRGILHHDVKPTNLLVQTSNESPQGRLRLIDFGTSQHYRMNEAAVAGGTPAYQPDRARVDAGDVNLDLYALGMSLYHVVAARLPFRLGDRAGLEQWHRAGRPAQLRQIIHDVSPVLNDLVERLTSVSGPRRFLRAREALDVLQERVAVRRTTTGGEWRQHLWFAGRAALVPSCARRVVEVADRVHLVVGPEGSGHGAFLEAIAGRLQMEGLHVFSFKHWDDVETFRAVQRFAGELDEPSPSSSLSSKEDDVADVLLRLRKRSVVILLSDVFDASSKDSASDDPSNSPARLFVRAVASRQRFDGNRKSPRLLIATKNLARALATAAAPPAGVQILHLDPLGSAEIRAIVREFFLVDEAPDWLIKRLEAESEGLPQRVFQALARLEQLGLQVDSFGHLRVPRELPDRLVNVETSLAESLSKAEKVVLGALLLVRERATLEQLIEYFPHETSLDWRSSLDSLRAHGVCRLVGTPERPEFEATVRVSEHAELLEPKEWLRLRQQIATYFQPKPGATRHLSCRELLIYAENTAALGAPKAAMRQLSRVASRLLHRQLDAEFVAATERCGGRDALQATTDGRSFVLRLRLAQAYFRLSRFDDVLTALDRDRISPVWFQRQAARLAFEALRANGRTAEAHDVLEDALERECARGDALIERLAAHEWHARLAPTCFALGDVDSGAHHLEKASEFLRLFSGLPPALRQLSGTRTLFLYAEALGVHGDDGPFVEALAHNLEEVRQSGRPDVLSSALNELGILHVKKRRWNEAQESFRELEELARGRGDRVLALRAVYNRAVIHYRRRELDEAESLFHRARALSDEIGRHTLVTTVWLGFAGVLRERGRLLDAMRLYKRVLRPTVATRPNDLVLAHNNLGEIYLNLGHLRKARRHCAAASRRAADISSVFLERLTRCLSGRVQWGCGALNEGRSLIESSLQAAEIAGDLRGVGYSALSLGQLELVAGNESLAVKYLRRGIAASRATNDLTHLRIGQLNLLLYLVSRGRRHFARSWLRRRSELSEMEREALTRDVVALLSGAMSFEGDAGSVGEELTRALQAGVARGDVWEAFVVTHALVEGRRLASDVQRRVEWLKFTVGQRLAQRLIDSDRADFETFWGLTNATPPRAVGAVASRSDAATNLSSEISSLFAATVLPDSVGAAEIEGFLDGLKQRLAASAVFVFSGGRSERRLEYSAPPAADWRRFAQHCGGASSRESGDVETCGRFVSTEWIRGREVVFEFGGEELALHPETRRSCLLAGLLVGSVLSHHATRSNLRERESALARAEDELRRLNEMLASGRSDLETELLTQRRELQCATRELETSVLAGGGWLRRLVGRSPRMQELLDGVSRVAQHDLPVLIVGESGTGKDLVARAIHALGGRRELPFFSEVCNLSENLIEAELFGFARGSFTGAAADRPGIFEQVAGGSVYLDEVTEFPAPLQAKILKVLEDRRVRPVGATSNRDVSFRLLASSRQPLSVLASGTTLRSDLFYRLSGEVLTVPPLRQRREDLPELVNLLIADLSAQHGTPSPAVHPEVLTLWQQYDWPGNVRELENELVRLLLQQPAEVTPEVIRAPRVPLQSESTSRQLPTLKEARLETERQLALDALHEFDGNVPQAAHALGISERYLRQLIAKHELRPSTPGRGFEPAEPEGSEEGVSKKIP